MLWGACTPEGEETYKAIIRGCLEGSPFYRHMGLEVTGLGPGWATIEMPVGGTSGTRAGYCTGEL